MNINYQFVLGLIDHAATVAPCNNGCQGLDPCYAFAKKHGIRVNAIKAWFEHAQIKCTCDVVRLNDSPARALAVTLEIAAACKYMLMEFKDIQAEDFPAFQRKYQSIIPGVLQKFDDLEGFKNPAVLSLLAQHRTGG